MPAVAFELREIVKIAAIAAAGLLALSMSDLPSRAQTNHVLVIPASDGYGFDDCLSSNKSCGTVIADAWCEAHGMAASVSFGRSDDITASIGPNVGTPMTVGPGSYIVNCKD